MNIPIVINKLSTQLGLTSRTLRHWETEGLFKSMRDSESGWRVYDEEAMLCIKITAVLRNFDIPLKDIKTILDIKTLKVVESTITKQLLLLDQNTTELMERKKMLNTLLNSLSNISKYQVDSSLIEISDFFQTILQHNQGEKEVTVKKLTPIYKKFILLRLQI